jgi:DNA replication protein DnaC
VERPAAERSQGVPPSTQHLPLDQSSANWIFQVVSRRYEKSSPIVLTSNRGFSDWGQVFADQVVASAIVDRLIHNAVVVNIRGRSYRMRAHQDASPTFAVAPGDGRRKGGD